MRVVHLTSVHDPNDVRIFLREAMSLAAAGFSVTIVARGSFTRNVDGVCIRGVGEVHKRCYRIIALTARILIEALRQGADIYHFHDPELIPIGLLLRLKGKIVVYDAHEDFRRQILYKHWIPKPLRRIVAMAAAVTERLAGRHFQGIIAATAAIARSYPANKTRVVQNYPIVNESAQSRAMPYPDRPNSLVYAGGISIIRGAREMVQALGILPESLGATLVLAGTFDPASLEGELKKLPGWSRVLMRGWVCRSELWALLSQVRIGLVLFHPEHNHIESQPNKLFEYMSIGLPVVASNFPLWREIVEVGECGLLVDPRDPEAIARAIEWLLQHGAEAEAMGMRGKRLVEERYNWSSEACKLLDFYRWLKQ